MNTIAILLITKILKQKCFIIFLLFPKSTQAWRVPCGMLSLTYFFPRHLLT